MPRVCGAAGPLGDYPETDCAQALEKRYGDSSWQAPDVMIIWAVEPLKSNGDGFIGHYLMVCHQLGSKIISIDPALTWWGAHAEIWLRPNPGTDAALALAMANVITQDLIDHEFVANWVAYYDEFKEHVAQFTPEWQESITNVSADDVRAAARMYAAADRGMIKWGLSFDASSASCMHWVQTACALMAICGNIEKPGTMILVHNAYEMNAGYDTVDVFGPPETVAKKFKKAQVGMPGVDFVGMSNPDAMAKALETGDPYPILMFWGQSCNQIAGHEEPAPRAYKYLSKVPFIVYVDPILTPSAVAFADMVLPVSASCERDSVRTWWVPLRAMKKVTQFYEAKTDEEIAFWLGERFNPKLFGPGKRFTCPTDLLTEYMTTGLAAIDEDGTVHKGDYWDPATRITSPVALLAPRTRTTVARTRRIRSLSRLAGIRSTRGMRPIISMKRACCAPTGSWDSTLRLAVSNLSPQRSLRGAFRRILSTRPFPRVKTRRLKYLIRIRTTALMVRVPMSSSIPSIAWLKRCASSIPSLW